MENLAHKWTQSGPFFQNQGTFQKTSGKTFPSPSSCVPVSVSEYASIYLNVPKYLQKKLNKGSGHAWSSNMLNRLLKMVQVLNVSGFWIWWSCIYKGCSTFWICLNIAQYASVMLEYASICHNVPWHAWAWLVIAECPPCLTMPNKLFWLCQGSQYASSF